MNPKVSVIVPVFNADKTLNRCLDSLKNQTLREIQIVCIDDGSDDNSATILEAYRQDNRFIIHHQNNAGVSAARNKGLSLATGEYVAFLDADDYVDPNAYEILFQTAKEKDAVMVVCDFFRVTDSGRHLEDQRHQAGNPEDILDNMFSWSVVAVWNRLIKREMLLGTVFREDLDFMEDKLFIAALLKQWAMSISGVSVDHVPSALVYYMDFSATKTLTPKSADIRLSRTLRGFDHLYDLLKDFNLNRSRSHYYTFLLEYAFLTYWKRRQNGITESVFQKELKPYLPGLADFTRPGARKRITLAAIAKGFRSARKYDWMMTFPILADKVCRLFSR